MSILRFIGSPSILLLYSNMVGQEVLKHLNEREENVIGYYKPEQITTEELVVIVSDMKPDVIITCYWPYLLSSNIYGNTKYGCINFHPSLLPRNRGWYPSVWEIIEGDRYPAGVTLHLVDEHADTGPIIAQKQFPIAETDTGGTIYGKSQLLMIELFKETWQRLNKDGCLLKPQGTANATYHTKKETNELDEINLEKVYKADDLLKLIKSKTFGDKSYAYYRKDGEKYYVRIDVKKLTQ